VKALKYCEIEWANFLGTACAGFVVSVVISRGTGVLVLALTAVGLALRAVSDVRLCGVALMAISNGVARLGVRGPSRLALCSFWVCCVSVWRPAGSRVAAGGLDRVVVPVWAMSSGCSLYLVYTHYYLLILVVGSLASCGMGGCK
jgi:hypothetical protein